MTQTLPLWLATALYIVQAGVCFVTAKYPQSAVMTGYAIANVGLIWSMHV